MMRSEQKSVSTSLHTCSPVRRHDLRRHGHRCLLTLLVEWESVGAMRRSNINTSHVGGAAERHTFIPAFSWEDQYAKRRETLHEHEDQRLDYTANDAASLIEEFLTYGRMFLDAPPRFRHTGLRQFLLQHRLTRLSSLSTNPAHNAHVILLDDRCDRTGGRSSTRNWETDEYMRQSPSGNVANSKAFDIASFIKAMGNKVS